MIYRERPIDTYLSSSITCEEFTCMHEAMATAARYQGLGDQAFELRSALAADKRVHAESRSTVVIGEYRIVGMERV